MDAEIDLVADLNAEDGEESGWSIASDARDPLRIRAVAMLVAGNHPPRSLEKNRHLIGRALA